MYTQRIIHVPAVGKSAELRAALEERNASGNAEAPHALSALMFSPGPAFVHSIRFESLGAIEAYQGRPLDETFRSQTRKIDQFLGRDRTVVLYEDLARTEARTTPKFIIRNRYCPAPGKGGELRGVLEKRMSQDRPGLGGAGLSQQVFSPDGPAYAITLLFGSLADVDQFRAANAQDQTFASYLNQVASLCRAPLQQRVHRVIAPFPA